MLFGNMKKYQLLAHALSWLPFIWLVYALLTRQLGGDPQEKVLHELGSWGLIFLLLSLSMTPARLIAKRIAWVRFRRLLGLYSAFYISLHLLMYLIFYLQFDLALLASEVFKRPYITVGTLGFLLMIPMVITSTRKAQKKLGKRWKALHRLAYLVVALGLIHFLWQSKSDFNEPLLYVGWATILVGARWFNRVKTLKPAKNAEPAKR